MCASKRTTWSRCLKARTTGYVTAWSPPITTGRGAGGGGPVAADHYRQGAGGEDPGHVARDVVERLLHVRVHDVGVPAVDEATVDSLVVEVPAILGDVVIPALTVHGATAGELD